MRDISGYWPDDPLRPSGGQAPLAVRPPAGHCNYSREKSSPRPLYSGTDEEKIDLVYLVNILCPALLVLSYQIYSDEVPFKSYKIK